MWRAGSRDKVVPDGGTYQRDDSSILKSGLIMKENWQYERQEEEQRKKKCVCCVF